MMTETDTADGLRADIVSARRALRQAIEVASDGWERSRAPRSGEAEVWSPREVAEHAIAAEVAFAGAVARAIGVAPPERFAPTLPEPQVAAAGLAHAAAAADVVHAAVTDAHLELETDMGRTVRSILRLAAWHLRDHARQMVGVQ